MNDGYEILPVESKNKAEDICPFFANYVLQERIIEIRIFTVMELEALFGGRKIQEILKVVFTHSEHELRPIGGHGKSDQDTITTEKAENAENTEITVPLFLDSVFSDRQQSITV